MGKRTGPTDRPAAMKVDIEELEKLAAMQCTTQEIADWFGISKDTIERRFMDLLNVGRSKGKISMKRALFTKAQKGDLGAIIWWQKNFSGMSDKIEQKSEVTSKGFVIEFAEDAGQKEG